MGGNLANNCACYNFVGTIMAVVAGWRDQRVFGDTEDDGVEGHKVLVAGAAIGSGIESNMWQHCICRALGGDAIMARHAGCRANIGMAECCHPSGEGRVAGAAAGADRERNMRRWLEFQQSGRNRLTSAVASDASRCRYEAMFRRAENCGRECGEILVAIVACVRRRNMRLYCGVLLTFGRDAIMARHAGLAANGRRVMDECRHPGGEGRVALDAIGCR